MKNTHDKTTQYLIENGWQYKVGLGFSHDTLLTPDIDGDYVSIQEALSIQKDYDPQGYEEFQLLTALDSRSASMYANYMDS